MKNLTEFETRAIASQKKAQATIDNAQRLARESRAVMEKLADTELMAEAMPPDQLGRLGMRNMLGNVHNYMPGIENMYGMTFPSEGIAKRYGPAERERSIGKREPKAGSVYLATDYISHPGFKGAKFPVTSGKQKNTLGHEARHLAFSELKKEGVRTIPKLLKSKLGDFDAEEFMMRLAELMYSDLDPAEKAGHLRFMNELSTKNKISSDERQRLIKVGMRKLKSLESSAGYVSDTRNKLGASGG